jgi:hypothetical protein
MKQLMLKYSLYILRWQLSTPILALFTGGLTLSSFKNSMFANFTGALIFFWVDKWIFKERNTNE